MDGLSAFLLVCFGFGLVTVLLALVSGVGHLPIHVGHIHLDLAGHHVGAPAPLHGSGEGAGGGADGVSPFNAMSILTFLTWFGGVGFLLHGPFGVWGWLSLLVALVAGLLVGGAVFLFLARVLAPASTPLDPADFDLVGQVGRVGSPIGAGGTGEVLYSQHGRRHVIGAQALDGRPLPRGLEVVIVELDHGLARVEPWEQFVARAGNLPTRVAPEGSGSSLPVNVDGKERSS